MLKVHTDHMYTLSWMKKNKGNPYRMFHEWKKWLTQTFEFRKCFRTVIMNMRYSRVSRNTFIPWNKIIFIIIMNFVSPVKSSYKSHVYHFLNEKNQGNPYRMSHEWKNDLLKLSNFENVFVRLLWTCDTQEKVGIHSFHETKSYSSS